MIIVILFLALVIRLISLNQSFWFDEAINVVFAQNSDFWWYVTKYPIGDFHPSGYFAILWVWGHIFGFSEISARIPSVIFGLLTIYFSYLFGKDFFNKKIGLICAVLLTFAPLHIYYSQEARMYSFAAFCVVFSMYWFIQLLKGAKTSILFYALSASLVLYSDYVAYLIFPVQFIYLLLFYRSKIKLFILSLFSGFLLFLPYLIFVFPSQLINGQITAQKISGWKQVVGSSSPKEVLILGAKILVGRVSFDNKLIYGLIIFLSAIPFLILTLKFNKLNKKDVLVILWLVLPVLFSLTISIFVPIFSYFRLLFIVPAFYLLVALLSDKFSTKISTVLLIIILCIEIIFSALYLSNPEFQREDWRKVGEFVNNNAFDKKIIIENNEMFAPLSFYAPLNKNIVIGLKSKPALSENDIANLDELTSDKQVYILEYLFPITDPNKLLEKKLKAEGFNKTNSFNFNGVGLIHLYSRDLND